MIAKTILVMLMLSIIEDVFSLLSRSWLVEIGHAFREANNCADYKYAKIGVKDQMGCQRWRDPPPPPTMVSLLLKDRLDSGCGP